VSPRGPAIWEGCPAVDVCGMGYFFSGQFALPRMGLACAGRIKFRSPVLTLLPRFWR
jgi:hypothetical protein